MDILKLNSISPKANDVLEGYNLTTECAEPAGVLVRSFNMHEWEVPASLLAVARAGAGVNNIPCEDYARRGICVFNSPGANSNAVKELVIAAMLTAARNLYDGISWASSLEGDDAAKQVEKGKAKFAGTEISGKTLCVLGLGAIGRKVAAAANALGMTVKGYDPYLSESAKTEIEFVTVCDTVTAALSEADYVSLHMPMTAETKGMIDSAAISVMSDGVVLVNAARGELVNVADVKTGLAEGKLRAYVTDFPTPETIGVKGILTIPHLGASTEEAEDNCAIMAAEELKDYIETGNIRNSVNFPALSAPLKAAHRVSVISEEGVNLPYPRTSATRNGICYALIDTDAPVDIEAIVSLPGVIRVRTIR